MPGTDEIQTDERQAKERPGGQERVSDAQAGDRAVEDGAVGGPSRMIPRLLVVLIAVGCVGVTALLILNVFGARPDGKDQGPLRGGVSGPSMFDNPLKLRSFELIDQNGKAFGSEQLKGKVYIASFVFTRCMDTCPAVLRRTELLRDKINKEFTFKHIRLISLTLDPEYDTPERLVEVAKLREAKPDQWVFLTGEKDKVMSLIRGPDGFKTPAIDDKKNKAMPIKHNSNYVLVDQDGKIRGYYDALKPSMQEQLMKDVAQLLQSQ